MKEDFIYGIRNFITNKRENHSEIDLKALGYMSIIGFSPSKLIKGKKLYNELISFINTHHILDHYSPEVFENSVFEKLILYVNQYKWQRDKVIIAEEFKNDIDKTNDTTSTKTKKINSRKNLFLNTVEYGIINRKVDRNKYTEIDLQLTRLLNEFNNWIKDYIKCFNVLENEMNSFVQLLKLIVSK